MSRHHTTRHRSTHRHHLAVPHGDRDLIDSAATALAVFGEFIASPLRFETLVLPVDDDHIGSTIVVFSGKGPTNSIADVIDTVARSCDASPYRQLYAATVRPDEEPGVDDLYHWYDAVDAAHWNGCSLLEWFVIGTHSAWPIGDIVERVIRER